MQEVIGSTPLSSTIRLPEANSGKFDNNFDNFIRMMKRPLNVFKPAYLLEATNGTWFVIWSNFNPEKGKLDRVRLTFNLNRIADIDQRRQQGREYCRLINEALATGANYFIKDEPRSVDPPQLGTAVPVHKPKEMPLIDALQKALNIRQLGTKDKTQKSYRSNVNLFTAWLTENYLHELPVSEFTEDMFQEYLFYKQEIGHSNVTINNHLNFFKTIFQKIKKLKLITVSPLDEIEYLTEHQSQLYKPITTQEIKRIVPALLQRHPRLYLFTKFIPHAFIRPYHIARLRAGDIDYKADTINVSYDTTKNTKNATKQLLQSLKDDLLQMGYDRLPAHYYLFGKDFMPGPDLFFSLSTRAGEIWKEVVIDGLNINKKMYALKHTGAQYFVQENKNVDMQFLKQQLEHASLNTTEIYLQGKVTKRINEKQIKTLKY